jgi:hypothetical protein
LLLCSNNLTTVRARSIFAGVLLVGGLYNVLWGKTVEERDDVNRISAGKPGLELQPPDNEAAPHQMPGDEADAKV